MSIYISLTSALFGEENHPQVFVIRREGGQFVTCDAGLTSRILLVDGRSHRMSIYELQLPAQAGYHTLAHLPGTQKFINCLEGGLTLGPEGQEVNLQARDAVWFSSLDQPCHSVAEAACAVNASPEQPVQNICLLDSDGQLITAIVKGEDRVGQPQQKSWEKPLIHIADPIVSDFCVAPTWHDHVTSNLS